MDKLTVVFVEPPDDEAALVTLRSEKGEVVAFCHPCGLKAGEVIENRLSVLEAEIHSAYGYDWPDAEKNALSTEQLERTGHYSYRGRGRVIDQQGGLVEVQGFVIEMDTLCNGHVDFKIVRLNVPT